MEHRSVGFTLIELVIVILIGSILTSIAMSSFGNVRGSMAVRGARNTFVSLQARTRAQAIESGENVTLTFSVAGDSVVIVDADGTTMENLDFMGEFGVDLKGTDATVCMNPRGFNDSQCSSFSSTVTLEFWSGVDSATVQILPLGQVVF